MGRDEALQLVGNMLQDFSSFSSTIGGLEFYGASPEFKNVLRLCNEVLGSASTEDPVQRRAYIFLEQYHGKTSIAKSLDTAAKNRGIQSFYLDGTLGLTQKELKDLRRSRDSLILLDGLPASASQRGTVLERFNALSGRAILFSPSEYHSDANLDAQVQTVRLSHVDDRPLDKIAWLIGLIRELFRNDTSADSGDLVTATTQLPSSALVALSKVSLGPRIKELPELAARCADMMRLRVQLGPRERLGSEDLTGLFLEFYAPPLNTANGGFRLWVEGETDSRLLKLVSKLAYAAKGVDVAESLSILPLGSGRDGGTSKVPEIVVEKSTRRNRDLFLFDCDQPGRNAKEKLQILDQDAVLLEPQLSCSRCDTEVEIEDFVSLSCLDRFYEHHSAYRPEKEIIRYKAPTGRRVVVEGSHKEALMQWLEANAEFADVENMFFLLCEIRDRFSLRNPLSPAEMIAWKRRLQVDLEPLKHLGSRPRHWVP
ncbi:hypothetical protein [Tunturiibacter gelidiferens]|uniref:hypothetical protein n=1 Tax=Tunturiibacter gelidiferens TaxID=3069689 RepID=UPI003D9B6478